MISESGEICFADSIDDAAAMLADRARGLVPIAGATWLIRAPLRKEAVPQNYLSLTRIAEMKGITCTDDAVTIGALATHQELADTLAGDGQFQGLAAAGGTSANPGVRRLATVGGNICATGFAAADVVPALLAQDAKLEIISAEGRSAIALETYLSTRTARPDGELVIKAVLPRTQAISAHARLTMRAAGDYPVAIVSVCGTLDDLGKLAALRIAVGSVESAARRWTALEQALTGQDLSPDLAETTARAHLGEFTGRDAVDAKGSYRVRVLPHLVRLAFADLRAQRERNAT
ncbi:molybdopterin dehydrogenase [Pelagivirga sediminicola]|uniref:Molybdopterin dehydrogenase n=1 Tax=Pelagivirga sediminicola TaxID=2170575 RepID=A0A2T7G574_9RHOB|nr:FAD binding domain-containing protein [Pelagivirga sediminicola]PVA09564.1 molybdopterin dehydrogenase [Pelagivirga sediminicola]